MWDIERYGEEKASFFPALPHNIRKFFRAETMSRSARARRTETRGHDGR
jgi:hypothetical protein